MRAILILILMAQTGCIISKGPVIEDTKLIRSPEYQKEIDELLSADAENKRWEKLYLKELAAAQRHQDWDAYQYFLREYIATPRFKLPEWIKKEPGYIEGVKDEFIESLDIGDR